MKRLAVVIAGLWLVTPIAVAAAPAEQASANTETPAAEQDVPRLRVLAEEGDSQAQYQLAERLRVGKDLEKDEAEAVKWYRKAAEQGHADAQSALGSAYATGRGIAKDAAEAVGWFRKAAEQGHATAQFYLGVAYANGAGVVKKDEAEATLWFRKAAEQGHNDARFNLALHYANGRGVTKDEAAAAEWYRKAAEQGDSSAQNNLGMCYRNGSGVDRDEAEAVKWFRKAAEQDDDVAMVNLADMLKSARGVERDPKAAAELYRRAAQKGNEYARRQLATLERGQACAKKARTALFESLLRCVVREDFRAAIKRGGARAVREDNAYWYDQYESEDVLKGSSILSVGYTQATGEFAVANYTFPSHVDTKQITQIRDMVASKYGAPTKSSGNARLGPASYEWSLPDGIRIRVHRDWPNTTTFLEYVRPETKTVLDDEIQKNKNAERAKELKNQSSAF